MESGVTMDQAADRPAASTPADDWFKTADGLSLHYRDRLAGGETTGVPVLCLHGLSRNLADFDDVAPRIAALGRRVIAVTQRGRGRSDPDPDPSRYEPATYAGDMIAFLDALRIDRVVLIGTSMGGLIAMVMAAMAPDRLAGVVINDIGPVIGAAGIARIKNAVGAAAPVKSWAEAVARVRANNQAAFPDETGDAFWETLTRRTFVEEGPDRIVAAFDPAITRTLGGSDEAPPDLWPLFEALAAIPTLIVRGALSDILEPETVAEMRARKPDLRVVEAPRVGHAPFLVEPAAWAGLERFLSEVD